MPGTLTTVQTWRVQVRLAAQDRRNRAGRTAPPCGRDAVPPGQAGPGRRPATPPRGPADGSPGTTDDVFPHEPRWRQAAACAQRIDDALSDLAIAARQHPAPGPRLMGAAGRLVLDGVYLLAAEHAAGLPGLVHGLAASYDRVAAEVSGPWPPGSFADLRPGPRSQWPGPGSQWPGPGSQWPGPGSTHPEEAR